MLPYRLWGLGMIIGKFRKHGRGSVVFASGVIYSPTLALSGRGACGNRKQTYGIAMSVIVYVADPSSQASPRTLGLIPATRYQFAQRGTLWTDPTVKRDQTTSAATQAATQVKAFSTLCLRSSVIESRVLSTHDRLLPV
jgi:hypothetical protein